MKKLGLVLGLIGLGLVGGFAARGLFNSGKNLELTSPFETEKAPDRPLLAYTIPTLSQRQYQASELRLESVIGDHEHYTAYVFSFTTLNKNMTGQLNVPKSLYETGAAQAPVIILIRGYVPPEIYQTGVGTRNAAAVFAQNGYVTLAPDFFSMGGSDPEPPDTWQARFERPINVIELIKSARERGVPIPNEPPQPAAASPAETAPELVDEAPTPSPDLAATRELTLAGLGIWGHSNGGQIALSVLEILSEPIPTTLWAPVTAPFPYSVLFFSDEDADEGKAVRQNLHQFEELYDVFDFSVTQHLDRLTGPLQVHHGTADESALKVWSEEFVAKVRVENKRRVVLKKEAESKGTPSNDQTQILEPIEINYSVYPGADHNLTPGWNEVMERDLQFFQEKL